MTPKTYVWQRGSSAQEHMNEDNEENEYAGFNTQGTSIDDVYTFGDEEDGDESIEDDYSENDYE